MFAFAVGVQEKGNCLPAIWRAYGTAQRDLFGYVMCQLSISPDTLVVLICPPTIFR